ncbi:MAG: hypothetical protein NVS3B3_15310 [Aquirhabdus sp.]
MIVRNLIFFSRDQGVKRLYAGHWVDTQHINIQNEASDKDTSLTATQVFLELGSLCFKPIKKETNLS